ncbi:MAG: hypothetical protein BroJett038_05580 [Chloroflexota bacterium]|nr:MAG: hypothetical protein BroJett038_05580 [Chloroflexota bacterium]
MREFHPRHAAWRECGECRAPADLSPAGREQAAPAAVWLADKNIRRIVQSPFHRAQETAHIIGARLKLVPSADDDLREMDCGDLEGRTDPAGGHLGADLSSLGGRRVRGGFR